MMDVIDNGLRVYCSTPMWGRTQGEIEAAINDAVRKYSSHTGRPCSQVNYKGQPLGDSPLEALGESIRDMARADVVLMLDGWEGARGCKLEHEIAMRYGVPIVYFCGIRFKGGE